MCHHTQFLSSGDLHLLQSCREVFDFGIFLGVPPGLAYEGQILQTVVLTLAEIRASRPGVGLPALSTHLPCRWRMLPKELPPVALVRHAIHAGKASGMPPYALTQTQPNDGMEYTKVKIKESKGKNTRSGRIASKDKPRSHARASIKLELSTLLSCHRYTRPHIINLDDREFRLPVFSVRCEVN